MYEMEERKQTYEDARKIYMTKIIVKEFGNMENTTRGWP